MTHSQSPDDPVRRRVRAILFDLDNCLCPAKGVGDSLLEPVFDAIRGANDGALSDEALARAIEDCWRTPIDVVGERHRFTDAMRRAAWAAYAGLEITTPLRAYSDIAVLSSLPVARFLVTTGFRRLQESKIRVLGWDGLFAEIHVDAIDESPRRGKEGIFRSVMQAHGYRTDQLLVVGDSPDSEIAAGNRIGIATVQILRDGVSRGAGPTHYIGGLSELELLLD